MKISDIKGERVLDLVADLIDPIASIAEDEEASAFFKREPVPEGMSAKKFLLDRIRVSIPKLLKAHKFDLIQIMSAIEGVSYAQYASTLDVSKLIRDVFDILNDDAFLGLFISAQSGTSSGSVPENTGDL